MLITLKGLVLRETKVSDSARYITLLTEEHGKISVLVRGAMKPGSAASLPTKVFCFSEFVLYESHGKYRYNDATVIDSFFELSGDYTAFILASYVVGAADFVTEEEQPDAGIYRLTLNTLWALTHLEKRDARIIKGAFEMRLAGYCGFAPNLFYCADCGKPVVEERVFLDVMNGCVRCADCAKLQNTAVNDDNTIKDDDRRPAGSRAHGDDTVTARRSGRGRAAVHTRGGGFKDILVHARRHMDAGVSECLREIS